MNATRMMIPTWSERETVGPSPDCFLSLRRGRARQGMPPWPRSPEARTLLFGILRGVGGHPPAGHGVFRQAAPGAAEIVISRQALARFRVAELSTPLPNPGFSPYGPHRFLKSVSCSDERPTSAGTETNLRGDASFRCDHAPAPFEANARRRMGDPIAGQENGPDNGGHFTTSWGGASPDHQSASGACRSGNQSRPDPQGMDRKRLGGYPPERLPPTRACRVRLVHGAQLLG